MWYKTFTIIVNARYPSCYTTAYTYGMSCLIWPNEGSMCLMAFLAVFRTQVSVVLLTKLSAPIDYDNDVIPLLLYRVSLENCSFQCATSRPWDR